MINKDSSIDIRYLHDGVLYISLYTDDIWPSYKLNSRKKQGFISIDFYDEYVPDSEEREYISVTPEFDTDSYVISSVQDKYEIDLICVPKYIIRHATPMRLRQDGHTQVA